MNNEQSVLILVALRDFFMARNGAELARAYTGLVNHSNAPAPRVAEWSSVEFAFNRLFVGPRALLAPPFSSIYLDSEPRLMGQATLKVRYLYQMMGLTSPWLNAVPDDHLGLELDAYYQLRTALGRVNSNELQALRQYFLHNHLKCWLPKFVAKVKATPDVPAAIIFVVEQLIAWLQQELNYQVAVPAEMRAMY